MASLYSKNILLKAASDYDRDYNARSVDCNACTSGLIDSGEYGVGVNSVFIICEPVKTPGDASNMANIENMKQQIYNEGPIIGTFMVYKDFMDYDGLTIYEPSEEAQREGPEGGHAIEIVGWGREANASYWICRNSWGTAWPASHKPCAGLGFFYMKMGENTCAIEAYAAGALPVVVNPNKAPQTGNDYFPGEEKTCYVTPTPGPGRKTTDSNGLIALGIFGVIFLGVVVFSIVVPHDGMGRRIFFGPHGRHRRGGSSLISLNL